MNIQSEQRGGAAVVHWMLHHGRHMTRMREFGDEMCRRIVAAGIPISRGFCAVGTLHPQIEAAAYTWNRSASGAMRRLAEHGLTEQPSYKASPTAAVQATRRMLRRRLLDADCPLDYPILPDLRAEGCTDYVAFPLCFSNGEVNSITWATDHVDGYSDDDVIGLGEVAEALAVIVELQSCRRIAQTLMNTYVGKRSGARVLSGAITRGSGEDLSAVIWFCDLRGFTELADRLPRAELIALLNDYFEIMAKAVRNEGGEVLKFVGDGMLAIFEVRVAAEVGERAGAALRAARGAIAEVAAQNALRKHDGRPEIRFGLALHLGEVTYGNIGAPDRLDFTVIGPAVNHANRLEKLAGALGRPLVASASLAAAAPDAALVSLGRHSLRGLAEPQEVFAPLDQGATAN
jgi:adenylate cyclase